MTAMIIMIALAAASAIFFMVIRVLKGGIYGMLTKALASLFFIVLGVTGAISLAPYIDRAAVLILLGLVLGLIGDIVLDLKVVYPESNDDYLNAGMISFAISHIVYFIAVVMLITFKVTTFLICLGITVPVSILILLASQKLKVNFGKFIVHAITYLVLLAFMSIYTIAIAITDTRFILMAVGMVLFLLSDLVLSPMYFAGKQDDKLMCIINHTLYYGAQICIATFIFFI